MVAENKKLTLQEMVKQGIIMIPITLGFLKDYFNMYFGLQKMELSLTDREKGRYYGIRAAAYLRGSNFVKGKDRVRFERKAKASRMMQNEYEQMREPCLVH